MDNSSTNQGNSPSALPWDKFIEVAKSNNVEQAASIPEETYQFAVDTNNREFLVQSALKSLQNTDPQGATQEKAEALAHMMQIFAKMMIKELELERSKLK